MVPFYEELSHGNKKCYQGVKRDLFSLLFSLPSMVLHKL